MCFTRIDSTNNIIKKGEKDMLSKEERKRLKRLTNNVKKKEIVGDDYEEEVKSLISNLQEMKKIAEEQLDKLKSAEEKINKNIMTIKCKTIEYLVESEILAENLEKGIEDSHKFGTKD